MKAMAQKRPATAAKFEAQADTAARRAMRGDTNLSLLLSPAPAAHLHRPQSRSEPLPGSVRRRMERAFGADFAAVRIHRDASARTAAMHAGVRAMTAGRDIFFAAGAYAPGTAGGDALIAHELGHVLQQTGRRSLEGRIAATAATGDGAVQHQDDPDATVLEAPAIDHKKRRAKWLAEQKDLRNKTLADTKEKTSKAWAFITFEDLTKAHGGSDATFAKFANEAAADLGFTTEDEWKETAFPTTEEQKTAFEKKKATYKTSYPDLFGKRGIGWGFLYDCLKKLGRFTAALDVLKEEPTLRTAFYHGAILEAANNEAGVEIFNSVVKAKPDIEEFRRSFLDRLDALLLTPSRDDKKADVAIGRDRSLSDTFKNLKPVSDEAGLSVGDNELVYMAYGLLFEIEEGRAEIFRKWREELEAAKIPDTSPKARSGVALQVLRRAEDLQAMTAADHGHIETSARSALGGRIQSVAERIVGYWQQIDESGRVAFKDSKLRASDPTALALKSLLLKSSKAFFALEKEPDVPRAPDYQKRVKTWLGELTGFARQVVDAKLAKLRPKKDFDPRSDELARFYGVLLLMLHDTLVTHLGRYELSDDVAQETQTGLDDVRAAHRLRAAIQLTNIAEFMDWADLKKQAERWRLSEDRAGNHLYLLSEWEQTPDAKIETISSEIGDAIANWPISGAQVVQFFAFLETLWRADILADLLANQPDMASAAAAGEKRKPLYRQVNVLVAALPLPKRYEVKDYLFAITPAILTKQAATAVAPDRAASGSVVSVADLTPEQYAAAEALLRSADKRSDVLAVESLPPPSELLGKHPKTIALNEAQPVGVELAGPNYDKVLLRGPTGIGAPNPVVMRMPVFAWAIPSIDLAVGYLRKIDAFNQSIIEAHKVEAGDSPEMQHQWVEQLTTKTWRDYFSAILASGKFSKENPADAEIKRLYEEQQQRYRGLLRKAAIVERQILVTRAGSTLADSSIEARILGPNDVLRELEGFERNVFPSAQLGKDPSLHVLAEIHKALALLQLAPGLLGSAQILEADALLIGFTGLIHNAMKVLDAPAQHVKDAKLDMLEDAIQPPDMATGPLLERRALLEKLQKIMAERRRAHQLRVGFRGMGQETKEDFAKRHEQVEKERKESLMLRVLLDEPTQRNTFLTGLYHPWRIEPSRTFHVDGAAFTLVAVHREFTYFPEYGTKDHPAHLPPILLDGFLTESGMEEFTLRDYGEKRTSGSIFSNSLTTVAEQVGTMKRLDPSVELLTVSDEDGNETTIHGNETQLLDKLAHAATMESLLIGMESLGELTQLFAEVMIEVAVTIFGAGVGQYAKTTADIMQLLASDELSILIDAIQKDPLKIVTQVKEEVVDTLLKPETLIKFIMFPSAGALDRLFQLAGGGEKSGGKKAKKRSGLAAVIVALIDLAKNVGQRLEAMHERIQGPLGGLRGRIVSDPRLFNALDFVATYGLVAFDVIQAIASEVAEQDSLREMIGGMVEGKAPFDESLHETLDKLATLELPTSIVPIEHVIKAIGDLVIRLMSKKLKGKVVAKILTLLGTDQKIYKELADHLKANHLDPNEYWEKNILPDIGKSFTEARDGFVTNLYELLNGVFDSLHSAAPSLFPQGKLGMQSTGGLSTLTVQQDEKAFAELYPDPTSDWPDSLAQPHLATTGGAPLDPKLRADAEERFGHDFRHVRLHAGGDGRQATGPARALGLTSGSHVFIDPKVSLTSAEGSHILDHELAHVLQQTGPRPVHSGKPLEKSYDDTPRRGRPGKVTYDPDHESAAERIARAVKRRAGGGPIAVSAGEEEGPAPLFDRVFLMQIVKSFGSYGDVVKFAKDIDAAKGGGGKKKKPHGLDPANKLWEAVKKKLADSSTTDKVYAGTFKSVSTKIVAHLLKHDAGIKAAIPALVAHSAPEDEKKKSGPKKDAAAPEKKVEFKLGNFANILSGYVFARTGVAMQIGADNKWEKSGKVLESVFVRYLNLGKVDVSAPLWKEPSLVASFDKAKQIEIKQRLEALGPLSEVWNGSSYSFNSKFVKKLGSYMKQGGKEFTGKDSDVEYLGKEDPPKVKDYIRTNAGDDKGLRLSTHGVFSGDDRRRGKRESHHTTQFLLAQYFYNQRGETPFAKSLGHPWLTWGKQGPFELRAAGKAPVQLEALYGTESSRGGPMPAILLSYDTHRQGRLHLNRLKSWGDDDETKSQAAQGKIFDKKFKEFAPKWMKENPKKWREQMPAKSENTLAGEVHAAMMGTYRWMESLMSGALAEALPMNEVAYYRGVVSRNSKVVKDVSTGALKSDWDMQVGDVSKAIKDAKAHNASVMAHYGWVL